MDLDFTNCIPDFLRMAYENKRVGPIVITLVILIG